MKKFLVLVLLFSMATSVFADAIKVTVTDYKTGEVLNETVISEEKVKAVEYYVLDYADWIIEAAQNKGILRVDAFISENTDKNVNKINDTEKELLVKNANVKSAKEREAERVK